MCIIYVMEYILMYTSIMGITGTVQYVLVLVIEINRGVPRVYHVADAQ